MYIYVNGSFVKSNKPVILSSDRGFLLGDGIFTTLKVIKSQIIHFYEHYERLVLNSNLIKLPFDYTADTLKRLCNDLIKLNELSQETLILRISLSRGKSQRGIDIPLQGNPTILISLTKSGTIENKPICLTISRYCRNELSPIFQVKSSNYLESILARDEARQLSYDDGLLTNTKGDICETTTANIFFIYGRKVLTPSINDGVLPGITRAFIIKFLPLLNLELIETTIKPLDIALFNECFISNCAVGIQSVSKIGSTEFKDSQITKIISDQYNRLLQVI